MLVDLARPFVHLSLFVDVLVCCVLLVMTCEDPGTPRPSTSTLHDQHRPPLLHHEHHHLYLHHPHSLFYYQTPFTLSHRLTLNPKDFSPAHLLASWPQPVPIAPHAARAQVIRPESEIYPRRISPRRKPCSFDSSRSRSFLSSKARRRKIHHSRRRRKLSKSLHNRHPRNPRHHRPQHPTRKRSPAWNSSHHTLRLPCALP